MIPLRFMLNTENKVYCFNGIIDPYLKLLNDIIGIAINTIIP